ncbi:unnamed protein product [Rotaria magnacalcarata]|uniref:Uncharacterized protein n=3 Tax=Rotaria magnacalcarata TaxID=392030 RepID=A0A816X0C8_9BILA|nr:unnamed protein product [Rotaria magnacalcarata]
MNNKINSFCQDIQIKQHLYSYIRQTQNIPRQNKMNGTDVKPEHLPSEIRVIPSSPYTEVRKPSINREVLVPENEAIIAGSKTQERSATSFLNNARKKIVLGRSSLNWARLAAFYTVFYFCLGCFFVMLLYAFAMILDRDVPRYYNQESTMAVRTAATVVGMGFRPQPDVTENLIQVPSDPQEQKRIASSLRLFRDVYLIQKPDAKAEECTEKDPASDLIPGAACQFNWFHVVPTQEHPCSDNNMYGFKKEEPCILVKLNKVYGWQPSKGHIPIDIQLLQGVYTNRSVSKPDVYITCEGSNPADRDILHDLTYYSAGSIPVSSKFGVIPNYYFPYRNAPDHVQPFVLVQFKNLPLFRLVTVTCRFWAPSVIYDPRAMRGMVSFQLFRSHNVTQSQVNNK